jgi:hypothetical protein
MKLMLSLLLFCLSSFAGIVSLQAQQQSCNFFISTPDGNTITCNTPSLRLIAQQNPVNPNFTYAYTWTRPDGTTSSNDEITVMTPGIYSLSVSGNSSTNTCSSNESVQVFINTTPPTVTISPPNPVICPGVNVTLTASGGVSYLWNTGATFPSINVSQAGTYAVTATGNNGCQGFAATSVMQTNEPTVVITGSDGVICEGDSRTLTATANITVISYAWQRRTASGSWMEVGGNSSNLSTGSLSATTIYRVTINTACGSATSPEATVTVVQKPTPVIEGARTACRGQQVVYRLQGASAALASSEISWSVTGTGNAVVHRFTNNGAVIVRWGSITGNYTLRAEQRLGGCSGTATLSVNVGNASVNTQPAEIKRYALNNLFISTDADADCYQWGYYDPFTNELRDIPGETFQAYAPGEAYDERKEYWVKTWNGDCSAEPDCATVSFLLVQEEADLPAAESLLLFPNPNDGSFSLQARGLPQRPYYLAVTDALGRKMLYRPLAVSKGQLDEAVQLHGASSGLHLALLLDEKGNIYKSIPFILVR